MTTIPNLDDYPAYCKLGSAIYMDLSYEMQQLKVDKAPMNISTANNNHLEDAVIQVVAAEIFRLLEEKFTARAFLLAEKGENP